MLRDLAIKRVWFWLHRVDGGGLWQLLGASYKEFHEKARPFRSARLHRRAAQNRRQSDAEAYYEKICVSDDSGCGPCFTEPLLWLEEMPGDLTMSERRMLSERGLPTMPTMPPKAG